MEEVRRLEGLRERAGRRQRERLDGVLRQAHTALEAPGRLAESLVVYTKDPNDLLRERQGLAEAIERCRGEGGR